MSSDALDIVCKMDRNNIVTRIVLQCAPIIAGLKISDLLNINSNLVNELENILCDTCISYYVLNSANDKTSVFLYRRELMEDYFSKDDVKYMIRKYGYQSENLYDNLNEFKNRYSNYIFTGKDFPHEMGLFLGYPVEDVAGYIENEGRNFLYTGYWKVYGNLPAKIHLFEKFEQAREKLISMIHNGLSIKEAIGILS